MTALMAVMTTVVAIAASHQASLQYLAAWRLAVDIQEGDGATWERVRRKTAPGPALMYVPAFSTARSVVERLGVRLTRAQPSLRSAGMAASALPGLPATFSPVVLGRQDARALSDFVYLGLVAAEDRKEAASGYTLRVIEEELVYIPGVWDPRCVHDANWRLLLREFDDVPGL